MLCSISGLNRSNHKQGNATGDASTNANGWGKVKGMLMAKLISQSILKQRGKLTFPPQVTYKVRVVAKEIQMQKEMPMEILLRIPMEMGQIICRGTLTAII